VDIRDLFSYCVRPRGTAFDIGAHRAKMTRAFSQAVGPRGHVYSFECVPWHAENLRTIAEELGNVTIVQAAMCDRDATADLYVDPREACCASSLLERWNHKLGSERQIIQVETMTVDSYCKRFRQRPSVIKIDVEGMEDAVVRGAAQVIDRYRPAIFTECFSCPAKTPDHPRWLEERGYQLLIASVFRFEGDLVTPDHARYNARPLEFTYEELLQFHHGGFGFDLLAVHKRHRAWRKLRKQVADVRAIEWLRRGRANAA
jgi:FkbM family methyltransferase